jgi:hypothetical protein
MWSSLYGGRLLLFVPVPPEVFLPLVFADLSFSRLSATRHRRILSNSWVNRSLAPAQGGDAKPDLPSKRPVTFSFYGTEAESVPGSTVLFIIASRNGAVNERLSKRVTAHSRACRDVGEGRREEGCNAKAQRGRGERGANPARAGQRRREEREKGLVVTWRGMGILPMRFHD